MPNQTPTLDRVFLALSDPTRRAVLQRLSGGEAPVSELAAPFDMALPSFMQHLQLLESCGLVRSSKTGRVRTYVITPEPLQAAEGWMSEQRKLWGDRLDRLDGYLVRLAAQQKPKKKDESR